MGLAHAAGAKQQQILRLQQPGGLPRQTLQLLLTEGMEELAWASALDLSLLGLRLPAAAEARQLELFEQQRQGRFHRR